MESKTQEEFYNVKQVSKILEINKLTVYKMANSKEIECFKIGHHWRIKKECIDKLKEWDKNVDDIAIMLSLTTQAIYRLSKKDMIPSKRIRGKLRFRKYDIELWINKKMKDSI